LKTQREIAKHLLKIGTWEIQVLPNDGGKYIDIPHGAKLPNLLGKKQFIFIRDIYDCYLDAIQNDKSKGKKGAIITGNSRIGKSIGFLNYVLYSLAKEKKKLFTNVA
jgi:hypothetical protein